MYTVLLPPKITYTIPCHSGDNFVQKPYKRIFCNNLSLPVVTVDSFVEKTCENFPGVDRQKRHLGSQIYCDHVRGRGDNDNLGGDARDDDVPGADGDGDGGDGKGGGGPG